MIEFEWYKNWKFVNLSNLFSFNWSKMKVMKEIKGIFVPLESHFSFTKHYAPFMSCIHYGKLLSIVIKDIQWKDKYNSPRHEENPFISIGLFNRYFFNWTWKLPSHIENHWIDNDDYWEQALWYLYYSNKDINKAKNTWPWTGEDSESTWKDKFLTNKAKNEICKSRMA